MIFSIGWLPVRLTLQIWTIVHDSLLEVTDSPCFNMMTMGIHDTITSRLCTYSDRLTYQYKALN